METEATFNAPDGDRINALLEDDGRYDVNSDRRGAATIEASSLREAADIFIARFPAS